MKPKIIIVLGLLCGIAMAQTTPNLNFNIPAQGTPNWGPLINANFSALDSMLSGLTALPKLNTTNGYQVGGVTAIDSARNGFLVNLTVSGTCTGCGAVTSVFGRTGAVVSVTNDYAFSQISGIASVAQGGTGTASPGLIQGTNITITGTWPNQTINSSASGGVSSVGATSPVLSSGGSTPTISITGVTALQGNGAKLQLATGTTTTGHFPSYDASGNIIDSAQPSSALAAGSITAVQNNAGAGVFGDSGCTATGGAITCVNGVSAGPVAALATYGSCNTGATAYKFAGINDGTTNVIGATVSGGGAINESVFCNTTAWTCAAGCTAPSGSFTAAGDLSGNATSQNVINAHWTVHATVTTSPYTVAATDYFIPCDATSGAITLNLPTATGSGKEYAFKKLDASTNACAVTPNGTDTIDTVNAAQNITSQYANQVLIDSASGKWIRKQIIAMAGAITGASNNTSIAVGSLPNGMTATTQSPGDNTTNIATDAFVLANAATVPPIYDTPISVTEITATGTVGTPITILDGISNTTTQVLQFSYTASMSNTSVFTNCTSAGKISMAIEGTDADSGYVFGAIGGSGALAETYTTSVQFYGGTPGTFSTSLSCSFGNSLTALAAKCIGLPMSVSFKPLTVAKLFLAQVIARASGCGGIVDVFYPRVTRIR